MGIYNGTPSSLVSAREGIERQFKGKAEVRFSQGSSYASGFGVLVPKDVFSPGAAGKGAATGLLAEYFDNAELSGKPSLVRVEPRVYFNYDMNDAAVVKKLQRKSFSIRWTGIFKAPYTGDYLLGVTRLRCEGCRGADSALVYLDGKLMVGGNAESGFAPAHATMPPCIWRRAARMISGSSIGRRTVVSAWNWCGARPRSRLSQQAVETVKNFRRRRSRCGV